MLDTCTPAKPRHSQRACFYTRRSPRGTRARKPSGERKTLARQRARQLASTLACRLAGVAHRAGQARQRQHGYDPCANVGPRPPIFHHKQPLSKRLRASLQGAARSTRKLLHVHGRSIAKDGARRSAGPSARRLTRKSGANITYSDVLLALLLVEAHGLSSRRSGTTRCSSARRFSHCQSDVQRRA